MTLDVVAGLIEQILRAQPGLDKNQLVRELLLRGIGLSPDAANSVLYGARVGRRRRFEKRPGPTPRPLWFVAEPEADASLAVSSLLELLAAGRPAPSGEDFVGDLYPWQRRALASWEAAGRKGVVEAVTGGGKTRLALAVAAVQLDVGGRVAVVVPTLALMDQWADEIERRLRPRFPHLRVERLGRGGSSNLRVCDVLVASVQSAANWHMHPDGDHQATLIADECHHYGAPKWSNVLEDNFNARLGLTATYERDDDGLVKYLDPYFGDVCYRLGYEEALQDDVIAHFKIAFVGVQFGSDEADAYDVAAENATKYRRLLILRFGVTEAPFGEFMREVGYHAKTGVGEVQRVAGFYLSAFTKQRHLLSNARAKVTRLVGLAPAIRAAERTIIFAERRDTAAAAIADLEAVGIGGAVLSADMDLDARRKVFAAFEDGEHEVVAAPKLLDEGIDVPAADLAIVLASSKSRRQMIQRMGRVVRKKDDRRLARLLILFVEGTVEDPTEGAHQDFIDVIAGAADDAVTFRSDESHAVVISYLNDYYPSS
jgi:superfamily II DNA or RNA helicase